MLNEQVKGLQQLITNHKRRLQLLKEQEALYGISCDPRILIEIKDIEAKIADLQSELNKATRTTITVTSAITPLTKINQTNGLIEELEELIEANQTVGYLKVFLFKNKHIFLAESVRYSNFFRLQQFWKSLRLVVLEQI